MSIAFNLKIELFTSWEFKQSNSSSIDKSVVNFDIESSKKIISLIVFIEKFEIKIVMELEKNGFFF